MSVSNTNWLRRGFFWTGIAVWVGVFAGCGGDGGSGPSVSSSVEVSSSGGQSSAAQSSSSGSDIPGYEAATLDDIPAMVDLGKDGVWDVTLILGKQSGLFTLLFSQNDNKMYLEGFYSLDAQGALNLNWGVGTSWTCLGIGITTEQRTALCADSHVPSLIFKTKDGSTYVGTSATDLATVVAAQLTANPVRISQISAAVGAWKIETSTKTVRWELYDDYRYVLVQDSAGETSMEIGRYDVHHDYLVMGVETYVGSVYALKWYAAVKNNDSQLLLTMPGAATDTLVVDAQNPLGNALVATDLAKTWKANDNGHTFIMTLQESGQFTFKAYDGVGNVSYDDDGEWQTIGNWLILDFTTGSSCTGDQTVGMIVNGSLSCFSRVIQTASIVADSLIYDNSMIPSRWGK